MGLKMATAAGFEPTRGDPIGFQVQRLNHSAMLPLHTKKAGSESRTRDPLLTKQVQ
jgi:hypothetical protein